VQPSDRTETAGWFVQAAGRVWGPYSGARIQAFVGEGRVTPETPLGRSAEGPFAPAGQVRGLRELFSALSGKQTSPSAGSEPKSAGEAGSGALRALVVWADLKSLSAESFEALLKACGSVALIRPGLWLLKARQNPAAVRNSLSRRLGAADAMMVLEAPLDRAAWFNLGGGERALRHLWAGSE
jgi:hypothetical protein